jgi:hypothetical protein
MDGAVCGVAWEACVLNKGQRSDYCVEATDLTFQIRRYSPSFAFQTMVLGERQEACKRGVQKLKAFVRVMEPYLPGIRRSKFIIEQQGLGPYSKNGQELAWVIRVVIAETSSKPNIHDQRLHEGIEVLSFPERRFAARVFHGGFSDKNIRDYLNELEEFVASFRLKTVGEPIFIVDQHPLWKFPVLSSRAIMYALPQS